MKTNTKDWIQYSTAVAMITSAIVLAFLSFLVISTVPGGVLIYISEALAYAGGIFGVSIYFRHQLGEFRNQTKDEIHKEVDKQLDSKLKG